MTRPHVTGAPIPGRNPALHDGVLIGLVLGQQANGLSVRHFGPAQSDFPGFGGTDPGVLAWPALAAASASLTACLIPFQTPD